MICSQSSTSQIVIDNNTPYDSPNFLIDNILLGGGIVASNHVFSGDSSQIGWFNATNTNLGIDSGVVLATGEIYLLDPTYISTFPILPNVVTDPDLLAVANSVPPLLPAPFTNSFTVSSINDVAVLEFDFIPTSDTLQFNYVFGSQEYFAYENTQYNDVFGFFLSGPGISGPYSAPINHPNGSINLAIVPGSNPPLPITISSINSITPINQQYFIDNTLGLNIIADADGHTTVFTATAVVQCGQSYHIRLAIADGSDPSLSSYVWLEAGSFTSPTLDISNDLGIDTSYFEIPCNSQITLTANGVPGSTYQWNTGSSDQSITVGPGNYWVTSTLSGCDIISDTLSVISNSPPSFDLGADYIIPCNTTTIIDPVITGGTGNYIYSWNTGSSDSLINIGPGFYLLIVDDGTGCLVVDSITITAELPPTVTVSGGGEICDDNFSRTTINFNYTGLLPWSLAYTDGNILYSENNINTNTYTISTSKEGIYSSDAASDLNSCDATLIGQAQVILHPLPISVINTSETILYEGDSILLSSGNYINYKWYRNDTVIGNDNQIYIDQDGSYYVFVTDVNNCTDFSDPIVISLLHNIRLYIPDAFTPDNYGPVENELFKIYTEYVTSYVIQIYNIWGELLFTNNLEDKFWNGTKNGERVPSGTYYYIINALGIDGNSVKRSGTIQVLY
ncbi:MAG: choice-of-anchor L domain-containing protein [Bacteroidota bacterium]|nr:choice-of-anchor L domain-containing protein [Bacteroidota bacterium]